MKKDAILAFSGAFALGALAGYIAGLLCAPKSGRDLRRDIENTTCELCNSVIVSAEKKGDEIMQRVHQLQDTIETGLQPIEENYASARKC
jgi:gas vesicle protein